MDTTQDNTVLRHAETDEELRACFDVMHELRPRLPDASDFLTRVKRMRQAKGYRLLAAWELGVPVALAGYEVSENLIHGRFLYVDDLIVTESQRSSRWGARLIEELGAAAKRENCRRLVLDTGLDNSLAQRFYFRQGLLATGLHFGKVITAAE